MIAERAEEDQQREQRRDDERQVRTTPAGTGTRRARAASTRNWSPKCTNAAPIDASGRISRGNHTLPTRPALPTIEPVPPPRPAENRLYGSRPASRKIAKYGIDGRDEVREDDVEHHEVEQRVQQRPHEPERAVLVLDLQLLADQVAEELAVLPDLAEPLDRAGAGGDVRPIEGPGRGGGFEGGGQGHETRPRRVRRRRSESRTDTEPRPPARLRGRSRAPARRSRPSTSGSGPPAHRRMARSHRRRRGRSHGRPRHPRSARRHG